MILSDRIVLLHMPRTGGTWLHKMLNERAPREWHLVARVPTHVGYSELPRYRGVPAAIFVRNPWDWYVSYYEFARMREEIRKLHVWGTWPFDAALPKMESFTATFEKLTNGAEQLSIARFENIRSELLRVLREAGYDPPKRLTSAIETAPRHHQSSRRRYQEYYGERERELVANQDAGLIERFGYGF